jgi:PAS domain-containing protein
MAFNSGRNKRYYIPLTLSIKAKTALAIGFMFLVIFLVGGLGVYYLNVMAEESRYSDGIAKNLSDKISALEQQFLDIEQSIEEEYNYEIDGYVLTIDTLSYQQNLLEFDNTFDSISNLLVSEEGLQENYLLIKDNMDKLLAGGSEDSLVYNIKTVVPSIERIKAELEGLALANSRFIQEANLRGAETADKVINYMLVSGGLAVLVGLVILFGFPSYIGKPLKEVTDAISDFRQKRYDRRISVRKNDEFGVLANAFNQMAEQIESYESEQRTKLAAEETKSQIILNSLREAVLITDSKKNVIFVNNKLESLLDVNRDKLIGRYSADLALEHILIRDMLKNSNGSNQQVSGFLSFEIDGKKRYFEKEVLEISLTPEMVLEEEPTAIGVGRVIILKDITDFQ